MVTEHALGRKAASHGTKSPGGGRPWKRSPNRTARPIRCLLILIASMLANGRAADEHDKPRPARFSVHGLGVVGNRAMGATLKQLYHEKKPPDFHHANFVEDAAFLMLYDLAASGYLHASIRIDAELPSGVRLQYTWRNPEEILIERPFSAKRVRFEVVRGRRFFYGDLNFHGLVSIPPKAARDYFFTSHALIRSKALRAFSPQRLTTSMSNLRRELLNAGYRDAVIAVEALRTNQITGEIAVDLNIVEGPKYKVRTLTVDVRTGPEDRITSSTKRTQNAVFSPLWRQDTAHELTGGQYRLGYPDATVQLEDAERTETASEILLDMRAIVTPGTRVLLGESLFRGAKHTRRSFLRKRARLEGPLLDRVEVDKARDRLSRLGIFKTVNVTYEEVAPDRRNVVFEIEETKRTDLSVLGGYGSYDLLFGGVELTQNNILGIGHYARLTAGQSFKTSKARATYTIPEVLMRDANFYLSGSWLRREEISFIRRETTLAAGLRRFFAKSGNLLGFRYAYEFLNAESEPFPYTRESDFEASSLGLEWLFDRRDNALLPRKGFNTDISIEVANPALGGDSDYARALISGSYHQPLWPGGYAHVGLTHGLASPLVQGGGLPINKRIFPGGENSVRGYQRGEASPLNRFGQPIGAESALVWNLELEQMVTGTISVVGFLDGTGITARIEHYPFDEVLWSVGGGLRWNTIVGPVRLEYGHNLDPRKYDPTGTVHFSLGFPF